MVELRRPQRGLWRSKQQRRPGGLPGLSGLMGVRRQGLEPEPLLYVSVNACSWLLACGLELGIQSRYLSCWAPFLDSMT
jgi:hypothetical protein